MAFKTIEEISKGWVNVVATVFQLWDNEHKGVRQVGLLKDDTGIIKFISWEVSDQPLLELDVEYKFRSMPVHEFEDQLEVGIVSTTTIERVTPKEPEKPEKKEIPTI